MIYREYGRTGKKVSVMGLGGNRFREADYRTDQGIDRCASLVKQAYDNGINYFDSSHTYCEGKCQEIFRRAFRQIKDRSSFYISEKSMLSNDPTEKSVRQRIEKILTALDVDYLDFFHMWAIMDLEQYRKIIEPGGPFDGAYSAKEEGLVHHICFSAHCTGSEISRIVSDGRFEGITLGYNLMNYRFREEGLKAAAKAGLGIAIMNPLAGGVISQNPAHFQSMCESEQYSISEIAMCFAGAAEGVSTVLSGISNEKELMQNLAVFSDEKKMIDIQKEIKPECMHDDLCTGCRYCAGCPKEIPIDKLMLGYNQYLLNQKSTQALSRYLYDIYGIREDAVFSCIKCGKCEAQCTQHISIMQRIEEMNRIANGYKNAFREKVRKVFADMQTVKTAVYAAGPYAQRIFLEYEEIYGELPTQLFLFDSNPRKWGSEPLIKGMKVRDPKEIRSLGIEKIIIASEANYKVIYESLKYLEAEGVVICGV